MRVWSCVLVVGIISTLYGGGSGSSLGGYISEAESAKHIPGGEHAFGGKGGKGFTDKHKYGQQSAEENGITHNNYVSYGYRQHKDGKTEVDYQLNHVYTNNRGDNLGCSFGGYGSEGESGKHVPGGEHAFGGIGGKRITYKRITHSVDRNKYGQQSPEENEDSHNNYGSYGFRQHKDGKTEVVYESKQVHGINRGDNNRGDYNAYDERRTDNHNQHKYGKIQYVDNAYNQGDDRDSYKGSSHPSNTDVWRGSQDGGKWQNIVPNNQIIYGRTNVWHPKDIGNGHSSGYNTRKSIQHDEDKEEQFRIKGYSKGNGTSGWGSSYQDKHENKERGLDFSEDYSWDYDTATPRKALSWTQTKTI